MSAYHEKLDGYSVLVKPIDEYSKVLIETSFDSQVDYDIQDIIYTRETTKNLKRIAFFKMFSFPIEYVFSFLFLNKELTKDKWYTQKLYIKFLFNKITLKEFNKAFTSNLPRTKLK